MSTGHREQHLGERYWPTDKAYRALDEDQPGLDITVHGTPAPQGSKRHVGHGVMIESSKRVKPWREAVKWAALEVLQDTTYPFEDRPVLIDVTFRLPRPRSHYRTGRNAHQLRDNAPLYPAGKPDLDKLLRSTLDALTEAHLWHDDSRVGAITARKLYTPPAANLIRIRPLT